MEVHHGYNVEMILVRLVNDCEWEPVEIELSASPADPVPAFGLSKDAPQGVFRLVQKFISQARLAMSWRTRNARSFSGNASTSAPFSAATLLRRNAGAPHPNRFNSSVLIRRPSRSQAFLHFHQTTGCERFQISDPGEWSLRHNCS